MLAGQVAIVTGASGGIGSSIAKLFASNGAKCVVLTARKTEGLEKVREEIVAETSVPQCVDCEPGDVTSAADVASIFNNVMRKHGHVDILINNAGVNAPGGISMDVGTFRHIIDVNVVGCFVCAQAAFHHGVRRIINVGSIASMAPRPDSTAYTTSKYAIDGLTRSLA